MKNVKLAVLTSVWMTLSILSGCGPATEQEATAPGTQKADVASQSQAMCEASFCNFDSDCSPCPNATVSCNGGVCNYTYSSGGGGGAYCDGAFCNSDSDCIPACHGTSTPWCNNGVCAP